MMSTHNNLINISELRTKLENKCKQSNLHITVNIKSNYQLKNISTHRPNKENLQCHIILINPSNTKQ